MPTNESNAAQAGEQLREQLRVGVRMIEALELQITRSQELIRNEDDVRRRAEETIARLDEMETRLRATVDAALEAPAAASSDGETPIATPPNPGNQDLARKLRQLAEQLIESSKEPSPRRDDAEEHTIGIAVRKPVELELKTPESTSPPTD